MMTDKKGVLDTLAREELGIVVGGGCGSKFVVHGGTLVTRPLFRGALEK
jgi:hypothetical protein